jgi:predicted signal transduction protein with EAL and GGDEF domain
MDVGQIAMDDFGTGYSSLSSLSQLPLDILKIDRSFVERIDRDHEGRTIVYAIMSLANALGVRVTGKGIETAEQLAALIEVECHTARATSSLSQSPRTSWRPCSRRGTAATSRPRRAFLIPTDHPPAA